MEKIPEIDKKLKMKKGLDSSSCEENEKGNCQSAITSCSDDEEANADLSLEIVEKAKRLARKNNSKVDSETGIVRESKDDEYREEKKRKKPDEDDVVEASIDNVKDDKNLQIGSTIEIPGRTIDTDHTEVLDNSVMRKLLRGPRYFDSPDNCWGACYNCGEEGHTAINCTLERRKKPCFVCGSFEHYARQCSKGKVCFICKQQGHRATDCPEKNQISKICLKCGELGHNMFVCSNSYTSDDLKDVQCYVCKNFGHLCCANCDNPGPSEVSCYRCGLSGHTGLACVLSSYVDSIYSIAASTCYRWGEEGHFARECTTSIKACTGSRKDSNYSGPSSSCYRCGEEGHFARECASSIKRTKRNGEFSTPKSKSSKKNRGRELKEVRSAPTGTSKASKMKRNRSEFTLSTPTKHRGGWITDDPDEFLDRKFKRQNRRTPTTPKNRNYRLSSSHSNSTSNSHTSRKHYKPRFDHSASHDSKHSYPHRYSASHDGNDRYGRNYNHW